MTAIRNIELADPQVREELEWTIGQIKETFPGIRFDVALGAIEDFIPPMDLLMEMVNNPRRIEGTMAVSNLLTGEIGLVSEYASSHQRWQAGIREGVENGNLHPRVANGRPVEYSLVHEVGHLFHQEALGRFMGDEDPESDMRYRQAMAIAWEAVGEGRVDLAHVPSEFGMRLAFGLPGNLATDLSLYGALGGPNELCAESFVTHLLHPGESKAAEAVYEYLMLEYLARGNVAA